MELDDLKQTWKAVNTKLQQQPHLTDEEVMKITREKRSNITVVRNKILRDNIILMAITIALLVYAISIGGVQNSIFSGLYLYTLIAVAIFAFPWSLYTMYYLRKTDVMTMPLTTVITRINRYKLWMTIERIVGMALLIFLAVVFMIKLRIWQMEGPLLWIIIAVWIIAFALYLFMVKRMTFDRLKRIKKNLDELKE